jgi:ribosomal protein S5
LWFRWFHHLCSRQFQNREALRNLLHIDLYDNFGLAHDVYGKHNACHVYIRATPASREMVASDYAEHVLNLFGINSASVKIIGNRNPYSQINAIFNALSHHENLDEYAKSTGQRYLTLRWAHRQNL